MAFLMCSVEDIQQPACDAWCTAARHIRRAVTMQALLLSSPAHGSHRKATIKARQACSTVSLQCTRCQMCAAAASEPLHQLLEEEHRPS